MAANFGHAEFILTKRMKTQRLAYESPTNLGNFYLFKRKSSSGDSTYYECRGCDIIGEEHQNHTRKARITVRDGVIVSNPANGHRERCQLVTKAELEV